MKGAWIRYSPDELDWIEQHREMTRAGLHEAFCEKFDRPEITVDNIKALCTRRGWKNGRDGRIQPGATPANKGKKMPFNANSAKTQFKKGGRTGRANEVYKTIGTERLSREGYVERKIHDGLPMQSRWRAVHLLNWEQTNGSVPKGMMLKCLDGNKRNVDLSNWQLMAKGTMPFMNGHRGPSYEQADPELKPTILALAQLRHARSVKGRRSKDQSGENNAVKTE